MAYERLYGPLGQTRDDHLTSLLAAVVHNSQVQKKTQAKKPEKFMPDWSGSTFIEHEEADADGDDQS